MQTKMHQKKTLYNPKGDYSGFRDLLSMWCDESRLPVRPDDLNAFALRWSERPKEVWRTQKQWVETLRELILSSNDGRELTEMEDWLE